MSGRGYGDRDFSYVCFKCAVHVNHDILRVAKFKRDVENVIMKDWPLGGTILSPTTGGPDATADDAQNSHANTFPNRLFRVALRAPVLELTNELNPSMEDVRVLIEGAIADRGIVKNVNNKSRFESGVLVRLERLATRKIGLPCHLLMNGVCLGCASVPNSPTRAHLTRRRSYSTAMGSCSRHSGAA